MIPLRLLLDTNVVVSAALKPGALQRTVFLLAITKPALLYMSPEILQEYGEVLSRAELHIRKSLRNQFLALLKKHARLVHPSVLIHVTQDPTDNLFLECADAARADYLVTGNALHFPTFWKKTKIITSREFVEVVAPHLVS